VITTRAQGGKSLRVVQKVLVDANFDDIKEGDIIEAYQMTEISRKLQPAGSGE
jgi:ribosomal protein S26